MAKITKNRQKSPKIVIHNIYPRPYFFLLDNLVTKLPQPMTVLAYVTQLLSKRNADWMRYRIEKGYIQA
jgi:hypothetical protein